MADLRVGHRLPVPIDDHSGDVAYLSFLGMNRARGQKRNRQRARHYFG